MDKTSTKWNNRFAEILLMPSGNETTREAYRRARFRAAWLACNSEDEKIAERAQSLYKSFESKEEKETIEELKQMIKAHVELRDIIKFILVNLPKYHLMITDHNKKLVLNYRKNIYVLELRK